MAYDLLITAPLPTIFIGNEVQLFIEAPMPTIAVTSYDAISAEVNISSPLPEIGFVIAGGFAITAPLPEILLAGGDTWNELNIEAPIPQLAILSTYTVGILNIRSPVPVLVISGNSGTTDSMALTAPLPEIAFTSSILSEGDMALTAPLPVIVMSTGGVVYYDAPTVLAQEKACLVLNTDNWEVSKYTWQFDQLVKFGSKYLAIDSTGIYTIGGSTNAGADIDSVIETGLDDFGVMTSKRLSNLCVGWESAEDGLITVIMDGKADESYEYTLPATDGKPDAAQVKIGKPRQRKYISFKIVNQNGADFSIFDMEMILSMSTRKVQGI